MLDLHRSAFDVWSGLAILLEEAVVHERNLQSVFARALDLLFIQAFKSHGALYPLCVNGFGEDAATIARRLFEIALQVGFLCADEDKREERGEKYLAHFWHNAKEVEAELDLPEERRKWWEKQYNRHKKWLISNKNGEAKLYWFDSNFRDIAIQLGFKETYDQDYRFLSHVAHCSSRGLLLTSSGGTVQIQSDRLIEAILVYGTKYALYSAANWNEHFLLIDAAKIEKLKDDAIKFDFKRNS